MSGYVFLKGPSTVLNVLRMIKLFAWESYMIKKLTNRREEELVYVRKGKILNAAVKGVNDSIPLIGKVTTYAIFVSLFIIYSNMRT